jgi:hypothetical protein
MIENATSEAAGRARIPRVTRAVQRVTNPDSVEATVQATKKDAPGSKLADQGYVTLVIDLDRGKVATTPELAHEISRGGPSRSRQARPPRSLRVPPGRAQGEKRSHGCDWRVHGRLIRARLGASRSLLNADVINDGHLGN